MATSLPISDYPAPAVALRHLDELWFQVAGTLCNLECRHCFVSASPHNHRFGFLDLAAVANFLEDSVRFGVKEYYFTGGEPFLNPDMTAILERTLQYGPATVLTNGTILKDAWLSRLRAAEEKSPYSLEFRVSLDGATAAENDPIRGQETFERTLAGIRQLLTHGFLPIVTVAQVQEENGHIFDAFVQLLKRHGYDRPRIKILPVLRIGAEAQRGRGYRDEERVTPEMMEDFDPDLLLCSHSRIVTDRGVHVCPILVEAEDAWLGRTLEEGQSPFRLRHQACFTCYQYGTICANASSGRRDA
jgi:MoaA/NifB/PqqE/SkfB family radical SAM enzyme